MLKPKAMAEEEAEEEEAAVVAVLAVVATAAEAAATVAGAATVAAVPVVAGVRRAQAEGQTAVPGAQSHRQAPQWTRLGLSSIETVIGWVFSVRRSAVLASELSSLGTGDNAPSSRRTAKPAEARQRHRRFGLRHVHAETSRIATLWPSATSCPRLVTQKNLRYDQKARRPRVSYTETNGFAAMDRAMPMISAMAASIFCSGLRP